MDPDRNVGVRADSRYSESTVSLHAGEQLTLLTDGVFEARNPDGTLFGFDRARSISNQPAAEIARAAQHFGQEDDITVLTLARAPAPGYPGASTGPLAASPAPA